MTAVVQSDHRVERPALSARPGAPSGRSRNTTRAAVAVLLIVGGGLVSFQLSRSAGERTPVIAMARDVPAGAVIAREDLRSVEVSVEGVSTIPVGDAESVIGELAAGPLPAGSLVTRGQLVSEPPLALGRGVLSVPVPVGQVPVGLRAGSRVALLVVDAEMAAASGATWIDGVVVDVAAGEAPSGVMVVSVEVAEGDAYPVAQAAAVGKVSVVLLAGVGG